MVTANFRTYNTYVADSLYQWDINQTLRVTGLNLTSAPEVHFSNANTGRAIPVQAELIDHVVVAKIPNSLLQDPLRIFAHIGIYEGTTFKVVEEVHIPLIPRKRPEDYRIEDTDGELYSFNRLENMLSNAATKAQVANIVAGISDGTAPAGLEEAEIVDVRYGADGVVYPSAGEAVREQIKGIIGDRVVSPSSKRDSAWRAANGYIDNDGALVQLDDFRTYYYTAQDNFNCYFIDKTTSAYISLAVFSTETPEVVSFIRRFRYRDGIEDTLPTRGAPFAISRGWTIAVTVLTGTDDFLLWSDSHYLSGYKAFEKMRLSEAQTREVETLVRNKVRVRYVAAAGEDNDSERLNIYLPTAKGHILYTLVHSVNLGRNADNWRIGRAYSVDENLSLRYPITYKGEWEMAINLVDRDDFIGGLAHGDEISTSITVLLDGRPVSMAALSELTECNELRVVELTKMYDPSDSVTHVANHGREYVFTSEGMRLDQSVEWLTDATIITSYMTMCPFIRGNDAISTLQVTDHCYTDREYIIHDVSVGESGSAGYNWREGATRASIYSEKSGFHGTVEVLHQPDLPGGGWFRVQDTVDVYNKMYWTIACVHANQTYNAVAGEWWRTSTLFKFQVTEGTEIE